MQSYICQKKGRFMAWKILSTPTEQVGRAGRFVIFQIKMWSHCARLLRKNHAGRHAAALSYHTIFGIVPLAIVMLLIFQSFPAYDDIGQKVKNFVYDQVHLSNIRYSIDYEGTEKMVLLTEYLDQIVGRFFTGVSKGSITLFSGLLVIFAALALLSTIERAFNSIWHIARGRNFFQRIINYWALLTLGPLLLGAAVYVATQYTMLGRIQRTVLHNVTPAVLSYVISTLGFFLLYFLLPNTKVRASAAIWGAAAAALVWALAKWVFGMYVTQFIPYSRLYGVLGLIPLGVFWIFITWLIVLFGLELTFTTQNLQSLDTAAVAAAKRREDFFIASDLTVINIMREIAAAFEANQGAVSASVICSRLNIPAESGERILSLLLERGLVSKISEPGTGFLPAKDPANIKLSDIVAAVRPVGSVQTTKLRQLADAQNNILTQYNLKQILADEENNRP